MSLCKCGCGQEIKWQIHHKYYGIPSYVWGHQSKTQEGRDNLRRIHLGTKLSESHKNSISKGIKEVPMTKEHAQKVLISRRNNGKPWHDRKTLEKLRTPEFKKGQRKITLRMNSSPQFIDTKPELEMARCLNELGIKYEHPYPVWNIEHCYKADFYLPIYNTIIEVDGKYWHNYPDGKHIDHIRTKELEDKGYRILRFWENEFNSSKIWKEL